MYGDKANAMIERLQQATWLPPYDDTLKEVLEEIDQLHTQATEWLQYVPLHRVSARLFTWPRAQETHAGG